MKQLVSSLVCFLLFFFQKWQNEKLFLSSPQVTTWLRRSAAAFTTWSWRRRRRWRRSGRRRNSVSPTTTRASTPSSPRTPASPAATRPPKKKQGELKSLTVSSETPCYTSITVDWHVHDLHVAIEKLQCVMFTSKILSMYSDVLLVDSRILSDTRLWSAMSNREKFSKKDLCKSNFKISIWKKEVPQKEGVAQSRFNCKNYSEAMTEPQLRSSAFPLYRHQSKILFTWTLAHHTITSIHGK